MRKISFVAVLLAIATSAFAQSGGVDAKLDQGLGSYLLFCFSGGLVALLTPCVFPMVPVTISYFAKRDQNVLTAAISYCLGIVGTFAVLGVGVAAVFGATKIQAFATNPWVNVALGALFIVLALNLFGVFELKVGVANKVSAASRKSKFSFLVPVLMGVAFTLTSFTCTAPIVGALLALAAKGGNILYPAVGMASFGFAFCLPFLVLAFFPSALAKMPKSGGWLGAVKPALGFLEIAAAIKFLSNADLVWQLGLLTRPVFLALWGIIGLGLGLYLLGVPKQMKSVGWIRRDLAAITLLVAVFLLLNVHRHEFGELGAFLPPDAYPSKSGANVAANPDKTVWASDYAKAVSLAKAQNKNVFVDFTGVTCTNCRWMEENVFILPQVKSEINGMVPVQLYTDRGTPADNANQTLQQKIGGTIALPVYVIVKPDGTVIKTFEGSTRKSQEFVDFLKAGRTTAVAFNDR